MTAKNLDLKCPYCGDSFFAVVGRNGLTGYECWDYRCDATWNVQGEVTRPGKPFTRLLVDSWGF